MKQYTVHTTRNTQIEVSEDQRNAILKALAEERPYVQLADQDILLMTKSIVSIIPSAQLVRQEQERLSAIGKFRCNHGNIHWIEGENGGCYCWEQKNDAVKALAEKKYQALTSPKEVQEGLRAIAEKMGGGLKNLTDDELLAARAEDGDKSAQRQINSAIYNKRRT